MMATNRLDLRAITKFRIAVVVLIALLVLPTVVAGVSHTEVSATTTDQSAVAAAEEVTFVTAQGKEFTSDAARLVAYNENETPLRVYSRYSRYYDVDPLGGNRILFTASAEGVPASNYTGQFVAVEMNWRTGEIYREFPVPADTHDIDYLGGGNYAIADKTGSTGEKVGDRVYVYNRPRDEIVWQYRFAEHFPPYPKAGGEDTGYTHLNDIDAVDNASAFLVSPRNFDRVMLINRSTKEVEWTLGEEDNYTILNEQHNPELLSQHPVTVLVSDSENNRVVEYRRTQTGWHLDWAYTDLSWPRDADRLPNGNTLITDSGGNRALEVTPKGEVVWQVNISYAPYDAERLALGDEPGGPTAREMGIAGQYGVSAARSDTAETGQSSLTGRLARSFESAYTTAQWVIPTWVGRLEFALLGLVPLVVVAWASVELSRVWPSAALTRRRDRFIRYQRAGALVFGGLSLSAGVVLLALSITPSPYTTLLVGLGALAVIEGTGGIAASGIGERMPRRVQVGGRLIYTALRVGGVLAAIALAVFVSTTTGPLAGLYAVIAVVLLVSAVRPQTRRG